MRSGIDAPIYFDYAGVSIDECSYEMKRAPVPTLNNGSYISGSIDSLVIVATRRRVSGIAGPVVDMPGETAAVFQIVDRVCGRWDPRQCMVVWGEVVFRLLIFGSPPKKSLERSRS